MQKVGVAFSISKTFKHFWFILLERLVYLRLKLMIGDPLKCRLTIITFATPSWGQLYSFSWMFENTVTPPSLKTTKLFYRSYCFFIKFSLTLHKDIGSLHWFIPMDNVYNKTSWGWSNSFWKHHCPTATNLDSQTPEELALTFLASPLQLGIFYFKGRLWQRAFML